MIGYQPKNTVVTLLVNTADILATRFSDGQSAIILLRRAEELITEEMMRAGQIVDGINIKKPEGIDAPFDASKKDDVVTYLTALHTHIVARKDYQTALLVSDRILAIDPLQGENHLRRGMDLRNMRRYRDALGSFERALEFEPFNTEAMMQSGTCYQALKDFDRAGEFYNKAELYSPDNLALMGFQVTLALTRNDGDRALFYIEKVLNINLSEGVLDWLFDVARSYPDHGPAIARAALEFLPENVDVCNNTAVILHEYAKRNIARDPEASLRMYREAEDYYKKAIEMSPEENPAFHLNLGRLYMLMDKPEDAKRELFKSVALDPKMAKPHGYLSEIFARAGDVAAASRHAEIAAALASGLGGKNPGSAMFAALNSGGRASTNKSDAKLDKPPEPGQS